MTFRVLRRGHRAFGYRRISAPVLAMRIDARMIMTCIAIPRWGEEFMNFQCSWAGSGRARIRSVCNRLPAW